MESSMDRPQSENPIAAPLAAAASERAPAALRAAVNELVAAAEHPRRRRRVAVPRPRLALAAGSLAAVAAALVLALSGGSGPSVAQAAQLALRPATAPAPATRPGGAWLDAAVDGIAYPSWSRAGWRPVGARADTLDGHRVHTVLYADARGVRVGYAIVAGSALPLDGGRTVLRRGVAIRILRVDGAAAVTWQRAGHTCILAARGVDAQRLMRLVTYST